MVTGAAVACFGGVSSKDTLDALDRLRGRFYVREQLKDMWSTLENPYKYVFALETVEGWLTTLDILPYTSISLRPLCDLIRWEFL